MDTVPLYRRVSPHGLMRNNGMNEPCLVNMVHNNTTKLAVIFALVGAMMIIVPMLTDQVYARTYGVARAEGGIFGPFHIGGELQAGKWKQHPTVSSDNLRIEWVTAGNTLFGGDEKGFIITPFGGGHVKFHFFNPYHGKNTCSVEIVIPGRIFLPDPPCTITQGPIARATYLVSTSPHPASCLTGTEKNDNLIGTSENDCIDGGNGNDKITGLAGNDKLNGGDGKDILLGGNDNDELTGGPGPDTFQCGSGNDKITDFKPSEGDKKTSDCEQL
jgi:Ca2+-binding RTX toxin-like protein